MGSNPTQRLIPNVVQISEDVLSFHNLSGPNSSAITPKFNFVEVLVLFFSGLSPSSSLCPAACMSPPVSSTSICSPPIPNVFPIAPNILSSVLNCQSLMPRPTYPCDPRPVSVYYTLCSCILISFQLVNCSLVAFASTVREECRESGFHGKFGQQAARSQLNISPTSTLHEICRISHQHWSRK